MFEINNLGRVRRAVAGVVAGDQAAWQSDWHRMGRLPAKRAAGLAALIRFSAEQHHTTPSMPHLHSTPVSAMDLTSTADDADWFAASALSVLDRNLQVQPADGVEVWRQLARERQDDPTRVRCRIGASAALANLAIGLEPPQSGRYNVHYFDDIAMIGGIAAGLRHPGDAHAAVSTSDRFAATHGDDGLWAAKAVAALVATLDGPQTIDDAIKAALEVLPEGSWSDAVAREALRVTDSVTDPRARAEILQRCVVDPVYSYTPIAPETLALLLAHLRGASSASDLLLGVALHPRHQDTLLALGGAVAAVAHHATWPLSSTQLPGLDGVTIASLRGISLERIASLLSSE